MYKLITAKKTYLIKDLDVALRKMHAFAALGIKAKFIGLQHEEIVTVTIN